MSGRTHACTGRPLGCATPAVVFEQLRERRLVQLEEAVVGVREAVAEDDLCLGIVQHVSSEREPQPNVV